VILEKGHKGTKKGNLILSLIGGIAAIILGVATYGYSLPGTGFVVAGVAGGAAIIGGC